MEKIYTDFSGRPLVKTPHFHCRGCRFSPWSGDKSHMLDSVAKNKTKQKKRLNKIMCKYIHTHTMYMYTYMCIIETLCCKAEINRTLESSCASLKKYHHWEKKKDWYVSLYVKFISKENCYKKNMAHYLMAGLQKYLRRCILMSAIYHKMHQGKRLMIG